MGAQGPQAQGLLPGGAWRWQEGKSETYIGSVVLHGEELVSFLEGRFGLMREDDDLFEEFDEDDAAAGIANAKSDTSHKSECP